MKCPYAVLRAIGGTSKETKTLSFTHKLSFFFFINPLRLAAAQWMAIKCIPKVKLQQLV